MLQNNFKKIIWLILFSFFQIHSVSAMQVAITVDDIPANGELPSASSRMEVANKMLAVFEKHHIKGVYGFMNGRRMNQTRAGTEILSQWVKQGQLLSNHTYSHLDLAKSNSQEFIADIQKNEYILKQFMSNKDYHYFRYPYLAEGNSQKKRDAIREFLLNNDYKTAQVTVDFFDYEWNASYVRCLNKNDKKSIAWLKKAYIEQAINALTISHHLSMLLFNRDIKNILLIHINYMNAEMLDELLTVYEKQGIQFISLSDALNDEVYKINPNVVLDRPYTFLNQIRLSRGLNNPEIVKELYASFPEDELNKLCK